MIILIKLRLSGDKDETVNHISEYSKPTQSEYDIKHDWVVHWE